MEEINKLLLKKNFPQWLKKTTGLSFDEGYYKYGMVRTFKLAIISQFIREKFGVVISIERNASGYFYQLCKRDGGTDLGWSDHHGPNYGGAWGEYNDAWKDAIELCLFRPLPKSQKEFSHWANYAEWVRRESI